MIKKKDARDIIERFLSVLDLLELTTISRFRTKNLVNYYVAKGLVETRYE